MELISTHNSATGNPGHGLLSKLLTPFAKCQSKTLTEQYDAGCRYFDLRVINTGSRGLVTAHGPWRGVTFHDALKELEAACSIDNGFVYIDVTWEENVSDWSDSKKKYSVDIIQHYVQHANFDNRDREPVRLVSICGKHPFGTVFWKSDKYKPTIVQKIKALYWFTWRLLIPIPWFWHKVYGQAEFSDEYYTQVDFL